MSYTDSSTFKSSGAEHTAARSTTASTTAQEVGNHQESVPQAPPALEDEGSATDIFCFSLSGMPGYLWDSVKSVGGSILGMGATSFPFGSFCT